MTLSKILRLSLENFRKQTDGIEKAELRTEASESGDFTEVEVRIEAGAIPADELEHATRHRQESRKAGEKDILANA